MSTLSLPQRHISRSVRKPCGDTAAKAERRRRDGTSPQPKRHADPRKHSQIPQRMQNQGKKPGWVAEGAGLTSNLL